MLKLKVEVEKWIEIRPSPYSLSQLKVAWVKMPFSDRVRVNSGSQLKGYTPLFSPQFARIEINLISFTVLAWFKERTGFLQMNTTTYKNHCKSQICDYRQNSKPSERKKWLQAALSLYSSSSQVCNM